MAKAKNATVTELVDALTAAVAKKAKARDALVLLTTDLALSKAKIVELEKKYAKANSPNAKQMDAFLAGVDDVIAKLESSDKKLKESKGSLGKALKNVVKAREHMETVLADYAKFSKAKGDLNEKLNGTVGRLLKGLLGSAATMPPLNGLLGDLLP